MSEPIAWVHEDNPALIISAGAKKLLKGSVADQFNIPLGNYVDATQEVQVLRLQEEALSDSTAGLERERDKFRQALLEISGNLDEDGNSAFCDYHEDCQERAKRALKLSYAD